MMRPIRLLVVDRDPLVRQRHRSMLEGIGYASEVAPSGQEALQRIEQGGIDAVIAGSSAPGLELLHLATGPGSPDWLVVCCLQQESRAGTAPWQATRCVSLRVPVQTEELRLALEYSLHGATARRSGAPQLEQAALLAHEFRSPLASIRTTAETLSKGYCGPLSPVQSEAVESIERNCGYLDDVLTCVGDLHDLEDPGGPARQDNVELAEVLESVLSREEYRNNRKNMSFDLSLGAPVIVAGDPRLMRIVFDNLISNAIKYGRAGTPIRIKVWQAGARIVLAVRNEGIGIPAADMDRLFRPFGRLRQPGSEGVKGSGLGLYLCLRIVALLSGSIEVQSEPGEYAEFRVTLDVGRFAHNLG